MGNILLFLILATNVLRSGSTDANRSVLQNLFRSTEKDSNSTHLKHPIRNESSRGRSPQELDALRKHLLSILNQIERDLHLRGNGNVWLRHGGHGQAVDREYQMNELQHFRDNILAAPTIKSLKKIKAKLPTLEVLSEDEKIDAIALKSEWVNVLEDAQMELVRVDKCRKLMKKFDEVQIVNEVVKIAKWSDAYHFIYVDERGVPFGRKFKNAAEQIERCWHALDEHEYPYKMLKNDCRVPKKVDRHDDYVNWVKKTSNLKKGKSAFKCKTWTVRQEVEKLNEIFKALYDGSALPKQICEAWDRGQVLYRRRKNNNANRMVAQKKTTEISDSNSKIAELNQKSAMPSPAKMKRRIKNNKTSTEYSDGNTVDSEPDTVEMNPPKSYVSDGSTVNSESDTVEINPKSAKRRPTKMKKRTKAKKTSTDVSDGDTVDSESDTVKMNTKSDVSDGSTVDSESDTEEMNPKSDVSHGSTVDSESDTVEMNSTSDVSDGSTVDSESDTVEMNPKSSKPSRTTKMKKKAKSDSDRDMVDSSPESSLFITRKGIADRRKIPHSSDTVASRSDTITYYSSSPRKKQTKVTPKDDSLKLSSPNVSGTNGSALFESSSTSSSSTSNFFSNSATNTSYSSRLSTSSPSTSSNSSSRRVRPVPATTATTTTKVSSSSKSSKQSQSLPLSSSDSSKSESDAKQSNRRDDQDETIRYFTPEDWTPKRRFPSSIDADVEYNRGDQELRKIPIFAARHPDLWLNYKQLIDWNCSSLKGKERRRCEGWEAIYRAIKRYIKFISIQNTAKNDAFFANIAVQPRFLPAHQQIDSQSTENTAILNQKMPKLDGKPVYEQRGGMELTQVMLFVKNVHNRHGTITEPVRFLNKELVEKVRGWAEFLGNFLKSPPHNRTYRQIDVEFNADNVPMVEHKIEDARHLLEWISKNNFILEGIAEAKLIPEPPWPQLQRHGSAAAVQQKQIGPTTLINEAQYRDALNFARTRSHKLWLSDQPKNVAWKCQEMSSKMRKRCMGWATIHWAIRHYIKFLMAIEGKSLTHLSESELPKIALFPKLKPSIARGHVKSEERLQRQQPFFEHNGFMELTQVMRKVENVYKLRNSQHFPKPLLFLNFDVIDNVWGWAKFAAEPGKYLSYQKANGTVVNCNNSKQFKSLLNEAQSVLKHVLGKMQENWLFPHFDQNILTTAPMPFIDTKIDDENTLGRNHGKTMPKAEDDPKNDRTNTLYHDAVSDFSQTLSDEAEHLSEKQHHPPSESSSVNSMKRERRTEAREILRKLRSGKVSFKKNGAHYPLSPTKVTEILAEIDQANSEKEIEEAAAKFPDGEEKMRKKVTEENDRYKKAKNESDHFLLSVSAAQQKWQQIERTLREQLEKRGADRYINRQEIADPYDAGQLIVRQNDEKRIILIPREEEIVRTVYHVANPEGTHGKLLGKNANKSWKNAKKCLNIMDDQNAEKSMLGYCKMAIEAEDRAEIYEKWASIGKEMQRGIPPIYMKNDGNPMKVNELLLLLEKAFNAFVNGEKLPLLPTPVKRTELLASNYRHKINQQRHQTNRRTAQNMAKSYAIADQLGGRIPVDYGELKGYGKRHKAPAYIDTHKLVEQTEEEERKASEVASKAAIKRIGRYQNKEIANSPQHNYRRHDGQSEVDASNRPTNRESPNSDLKNNKKSVAHNFFENVYQTNKRNQMEKKKAEEEAHQLVIDKKKAEEEEQRKRNWNENEKARLAEQKKKKANERHNEEERRNREKELHREWEKKEAGAMRKEQEKHIEIGNRRDELMEREKKTTERERKKQFLEEMRKRQETWNTTKSIRTGEGAGAKPKSHTFGSMY